MRLREIENGRAPRSGGNRSRKLDPPHPFLVTELDADSM
jgi:hypothetical protein